jgi:anhydro-N-acetylmuramic acid kinase
VSAEYFIGIMSGTSLDGIDIVLASISSVQNFTLQQASTYPLPESIKSELLNLSQEKQPDELDRYAELDARMGHLFADCCQQFLEQHQLSSDKITAIGCHGQTLRHYPNNTIPTTLQIGDPNIIAQNTRINTVADFRRRDMAAGGQGAPLVPPFHKAIFQSYENNRIILNIGGIANITVLSANKAPVLGYDTGPGNGLMDDWCIHHLNCAYDKNGHLAAKGQSNASLLQKMLAEPYFSQKFPKSTGREFFSYEWITRQLANLNSTLSAHDVLATLLDLTVHSIINEVNRFDQINEILICGGGVHNKLLMQKLQENAPNINIVSTEAYGLDPDWVEASAFAWLAHQTIHGLTANLPSVTGASEAVILGAIWQAG